MAGPLRVVPVVEAVAEGLREAILAGELTPGEPLTEAMLPERFDVPRPTVRSAVQLVMQDGLIRREPNRSVYVPRLSGCGWTGSHGRRVPPRRRGRRRPVAPLVSTTVDGRPQGQ